MDLARASKQSLLALFRAFMRSPATVAWAADGIARWHTPLAHPFFNGVLLSRPARPDDDKTIADAIAPFTQSTPIPFTLWLDTDVPRASWRPQLDALGFMHDIGSPGMALAIAALPSRARLPRDFKIEQVADRATLYTWCETFIYAYELPHEWVEGFFALMDGMTLALPFVHFLGRMNGRPVATSSLLYAADVVGVNFMATLPGARRRGLGGLMTLQPLYGAHAHEEKYAVLQASEMGFNLYKELGFVHVGNVDNEYQPAGLAGARAPQQ